MIAKNKLCILGVFVTLTIVGCDAGKKESVGLGNGVITEAKVDSEISIEMNNCTADGDIQYICEVYNAEDLLSLGDTGMILTSGMSAGEIGAHLYLINPQDNSAVDLVSADSFSLAQDVKAYPDCPGPLNIDAFSPHGLSLHEYEEKHFNLYTTSHGEREAVEMFNVDLSGSEPSLTWRGCVPLPSTAFSNGVVRLSDGGFVATQMMDTSKGFGGDMAGLVFEWHPGGEVSIIEGSEINGANGIAVSEDERYMYVVAFGSREIVKFDRSTQPMGKEVVSVDIVPDNLHWGLNGKLVTAGGNHVPEDVCSGPECASGWSVLEIDPETMEVRKIGSADQNVTLQGISSALQVGDEIWVGTFNGDRIAHFPRQ